jgi:hypothetical protein
MIFSIASCIIHGCAIVFTYNWSIGHLHRQYEYCRFDYNLTLRVHGVSMIFGKVSEVIGQWYTDWYAQPTCWPPLPAKEEPTQSLTHSEHEHQWCVNDLWSCKYGNSIVIWLLLCTTDVLAAYIGKRESNMVTAPFWEWASMECQPF